MAGGKSGKKKKGNDKAERASNDKAEKPPAPAKAAPPPADDAAAVAAEKAAADAAKKASEEEAPASPTGGGAGIAEAPSPRVLGATSGLASQPGETSTRTGTTTLSSLCASVA